MAPVAGLLAACQPGAAIAPLAEVGRLLEGEAVRGHLDGPPGAEPGTCWGQDVTPAVIETVTEHVMIQPPELESTGTMRAPPVYRTESVQRILQEREEIWFRTPCEEDLTPEIIATLQRALAARGHYAGAASGRMDLATRAAVRSFQRGQGLNSSLLSLNAARQLGLVAWDFSEL